MRPQPKLLLAAAVTTLAVLGSGAAARRPGLKHPLDENPDAARTGPYREALVQAISSWPSKLLPADPPESRVSVKLVAFETPGHPNAIGVGQAMLVQAPIADLHRIMVDFDHYKDLFFTFKNVKSEGTDGNRTITMWEQSIPIPFVPNTVYRLYFYVDDRDPEHVFYRYQLKDSNSLKYSDGLIVLDRVDSRTTRYTEYDFFDADWGIAAKVAPARIWRDSLRDIYLSDIAIKLRAEHPDWSFDKIRQSSKERWSDEYSDDLVSDVLAGKKKRF